jgi:hypothetical protein
MSDARIQQVARVDYVAGRLISHASISKNPISMRWRTGSKKVHFVMEEAKRNVHNNAETRKYVCPLK